MFLLKEAAVDMYSLQHINPFIMKTNNSDIHTKARQEAEHSSFLVQVVSSAVTVLVRLVV